MNLRILILTSVLLFSATAYSQTDSGKGQSERVSHVLDELHDAASKADFERYFDLFAENGIFLGTDATERWTTAEFKTFAKPHFDKETGWTYTSISRHIYIAKNGKTAWFDEELSNTKIGACRGSGVLIKQKGHWKISQYNLTIPIPNDLVPAVVEQIKEQQIVD